MAGAPRRSDVDFADVFGGPPRRSSGSDRGRRSSLDSPSGSGSGSASRARSGAEERPAFGDRTSSGFASRERRSGGESGPGERPVFGDRTSSERRQLGQEFYKDIFPGGEPPASPRRGGASGDRDVFGAPTSPGGSTSRLLSRSSFSMKFTGGVDSSVPTSPSRHTSNRNDDDTSYGYSVPVSPNSSTNSSFAQGVSQQDSKKNPFSWHRYPFLSRFRSSGDKKEKDTSQRVNSMDSECEGTPISSASFISSDKFHFSFYKWAGKGALLMLPASVQEKDGNIIGVRSFPQVVLQGIDLIDEEESMSTATPASKSQTDYEDYKSGKDGLFERKHSINSTTKEESSVFDEYLQGDNSKEAGTKKSINNAKNNVSAGSPRTQSSRPPSGEKSRGSRVLKDFIKIFSPEVSPKRKVAVEAQDHFSGKNGSKGGVEDKFSISDLETGEDIKTDKTNNQNAFSSAAAQMKDIQGRMEKPILTVDDEMLTRTGKLSGKEDVKPPSSDKLFHVETEEKVRDTTSREESHMENLEECVVEHLDEDQILQDDNEKEQIKISQSKIREWSKGKEGNIRSLLSTLQYVLWPESGWKPVPLVNIIEGAAVKKAYQRALLCLHPDKLQQRGAAMHQKYIAEKVFEILQEAWKEFNSVTFG
ncbi:J domain-containing protein required for chloroplast accumulation response 1 isoform X1 [Hordeum vulgare subsp. vulgare]|uniref:J domain-containing protein n=1 Tax=Hordeum vulgare subsp. vulgare TaxID=112509 RepID=A0A8I6XEE6_HORVV|nr:J domain-containing protein required for chloroplast accumulation response 1 isoform X1 [Hordeum vulgare subsp. vulgare]